MAQLKGNNLTEWIKALEPVDPESFKTMEQGTKIIHLESKTMEPETFYDPELLLDGKPNQVVTNPTGDIQVLSFGELDGWFYFPLPAPELPVKSSTIGKVKELGDGKWR